MIQQLNNTNQINQSIDNKFNRTEKTTDKMPKEKQQQQLRFNPRPVKTHTYPLQAQHNTYTPTSDNIKSVYLQCKVHCQSQTNKSVFNQM